MSATSRRCLVKRRPFIQLAIISVVAAVNDGNAYYTATKRYSDIFNGKMEKEAIVEHEEKYFQVCIPFLLLFISCLFLFSFSFDISSNVSSTKKFILQKKNPHGASHRINTQDDDFLSKIVPVLSHIGHPLEPLWPTIDKYFTRFLINILFSQPRSRALASVPRNAKC